MFIEKGEDKKMDDFLLSFFYPMMLVLAEILVKEIIKLWESQLKKKSDPGSA